LAAQQRRKVQAGDSLMAKLWQERSAASSTLPPDLRKLGRAG
jgi:hypothetical protein